MRLIDMFLVGALLLARASDARAVPSAFVGEEAAESAGRTHREHFLHLYNSSYLYTDTPSPTVGDERFKGQVYLDYTGSGMYTRAQLDAVFTDLRTHLYGNSHSINPSAVRSTEALERLRSTVLQFLHADPEEYGVVFTRSATDALRIIADTFPFSAQSHYRYLLHNHNSVIGIREVAHNKGGSFSAVSEAQMLERLRGEDEEADPTLDDAVHARSVADDDDAELEPLEKLSDYPYHLFAYPAEENFAGALYPLRWVKQARRGFRDLKRGRWLVLLDAAAYAPTQPLNITDIRPDFVCLSFYKLFGYPTGIGALVVRKNAAKLMHRTYFGGGTISFVSADHDLHEDLAGLQRFEDGSPNFLGAAASLVGFETITRVGMARISQHVHALIRWAYLKLRTITHHNGRPVADIYGKHAIGDGEQQGAILTFNVLDSHGHTVAKSKVLKRFSDAHFHIRAGCACNPGACFGYLNLGYEDLVTALNSHHSCSDGMDAIGPQHKALGAVRVSIGYLSTFEDIDRFLNFFEAHFAES